MNQKLSISVATAVLLAVIGAPVAAMADDERQPPILPSNVQIHQDDSDEHEDANDDGDDDGDDQGEHHKKGWIPPVFVVPGQKHDHHKPKPGSGSVTTPPGDDANDDGDDTTAGNASVGGLDTNDFVVVGVDDTAAAESLESVDPKQSHPVAIEKVNVTSQTPADRFMDAAYLGIGLLAISAVGLGATTAVRSYRLRKSGKSDYFYDN